MTAKKLSLVLDCLDPDRLSGFWGPALGYRRVWEAAQYVVLVPEEGDGPSLILQGVPEPKAGKNRMHLDIRTGDVDAEVERLVGLGAERVEPGEFEEHGVRWVVLRDPEGNELCVCSSPV